MVQQSVSQMGDFDHLGLSPKALAEGVLIGCCKSVTQESLVPRFTLFLTTGRKNTKEKRVKTDLE